jgi:hypothetical protein
MLETPGTLPSDPDELRAVAERLRDLARSQALKIEKLEHQLAFAIVARTMYGWLPRGKGVSVEAGMMSGAAMYTASGLQHDGCAP